MKRIILILHLVILLSQLVLAQKYDYTWLWGYFDDEDPDSEFGITVYDYNHDPPQYYYESRNMNFNFTGIAISRSDDGSLWFYSNGIYIANWLDEEIEGSWGLNPGWMFDQFQDIGYRLPQSLICLPLENKPGQFMFFHITRDVVPGTNQRANLRFHHTLLDMNVNGSLGKAIFKNKIIYEGLLDYGQLTATKHGNGKDWWVLMPKLESNTFITVHLTSSGDISTFEQSIGPIWTAQSFNGYQAVFTPDGSMYARYHPLNDLDIFEFNRCSGTLSHLVHIPIYDQADNYSNATVGISASPNSQFLYAISNHNVYQFDLEEDDIESSRVIVASEWGNQDSIKHFFSYGQITPDSTIMVYAANPLFPNWHLIRYPDKKGHDCGFEYLSVEVPTLGNTVPHYPNYRLGPLTGSPCDTLTTSLKDPAGEDLKVRVYPNPVTSEMTVDVANYDHPIAIRVSDWSGRQVVVEEPFTIRKTISTFGFAPGIYTVSIFDKDGKILAVEKFVVE